MLAKFVDLIAPLLKPAIAASRKRELESAIRANERAIVHADKETAQQAVFKQNAIEENEVLHRRLAAHLATMSTKFVVTAVALPEEEAAR